MPILKVRQCNPITHGFLSSQTFGSQCFYLIKCDVCILSVFQDREIPFSTFTTMDYEVTSAWGHNASEFYNDTGFPGAIFPGMGCGALATSAFAKPPLPQEVLVPFLLLYSVVIVLGAAGIFNIVTSYWARRRPKSPASRLYSTVYSGADQRKYQSSASLAFVMGNHRLLVNPRTKGQ